MRYPALALPILLVGCGASQPQSSPLSRSDTTNVAAVDAAARICGASEADDSRPSEAEIRTLGAAASETRFRLTKGVSEFRIKLLNHPLPQDGSVEVEERTWNDGDCRLTLWSVHRDTAPRMIEWLRWSARDQF